MPFFAFIVSKSRFSFSDISRRVTPYIPLFIGITIMIYNLIAFLNFRDLELITLGGEMSVAKEFIYITPWAFIYPGIALFIIISGFFILYTGLQKTPKEIQVPFR